MSRPTDAGPPHAVPEPAPAPATGMPEGFTEHRVDAGGRTLRYAEGGAGPVLLMLHGGGGLDRDLGAAHVALAGRHRVIAPELPGWGATSGEGIETMADLAGVVRNFADGLGLDTFALLGTSFGGAVALWTACEFPERVSALVLEAPAAFREGVPGPGELPPFAPDGTPIPRPDPAQVAFITRVSGPATDPDLVARMPGCRVPALVLLGTADRMFGPRFAPDYARLPVASVSLVYQAGHDIKGTRPTAFLSVVEDFLERGPSFVIAQDSSVVHA